MCCKSIRNEVQNTCRLTWILSCIFFSNPGPPLYNSLFCDFPSQCISQCLEFQFDSVINDRTLILSRLEALQVTLKERSILTWEFFLNRFDTLCLEAQLDLVEGGQGDNTCYTGTALIYRKTSNIRHTLVGNKIVDHSDVVGASPVGAAPTAS